MPKTGTVHERVGIVITIEGEPRDLVTTQVQYPAYKSPRARSEARRKAIDYALTRALAPLSPILIDWATNQVLASQGGWTRLVATFTTEQYQVESPVKEAA